MLQENIITVGWRVKKEVENWRKRHCFFRAGNNCLVRSHFTGNSYCRPRVSNLGLSNKSLVTCVVSDAAPSISACVTGIPNLISGADCFCFCCKIVSRKFVSERFSCFLAGCFDSACR